MPLIRLLIVLMSLSTLSPAAAETLTIERIFDSPDLAGDTIRGLEVSPGGDRVTFLRGRDDDRERLDLWEYHVADQALRRLVDSSELVPEEGELSDEEKARRERQRIAGLRGIVDYRWARNGQALLFPLGGDVYLYDLSVEEDRRVTRITATETAETDPQLSPQGRYVGFVRDQNLFLFDRSTGQERQLTTDGGGTIRNGMAEFVAQEEMSRTTGYWIAPDDAKVAFVRVDESPVAVTRRYEIEADTIQVIEQRYPYAGTDNVRLQLGVIDLESSQLRWIDLGDDPDIYLPRVKWLPDSNTLSFQRQSRDQQTLELIFVDLGSGEQRTVLTETADTWVDLHDDLHFLTQQEAFIWSSSASGHRHLSLHDLDGRHIRSLTAGEWSVDGLSGVDEDAGVVFFTAAEASPTERHLYRQNLRTDEPARVDRITRRPGLHEIDMNRSGSLYVDKVSTVDQPPQISLHGPDGQRLTWLLENRIDADHPYHRFLSVHRPTEFGTLEAEDGQILHYRLIKPLGFEPERRYPVFMYLYAGPTSQTVTNSWGRRILFEQYMAQQGYVVFSIDNRGTPRRGVAFQRPVFHKLGTVEIRDQLTGVEHLKSLPWVDPERIGLFGWSYGGYATLMGLSQAPEAWAAGVAVAPVTDWSLYDTHYTERYMGTPENNPDGYREGNVLTYSNRMTRPLLLVHGMADDNVLFTHSTLLMGRLQEDGQLFDLMTYPGAKHGISGQAGQTHVYRTIAAFFDRHLRDL